MSGFNRNIKDVRDLQLKSQLLSNEVSALIFTIARLSDYYSMPAIKKNSSSPKMPPIRRSPYHFYGRRHSGQAAPRVQTPDQEELDIAHSDLPPARMRELKAQLDDANRSGVILSFDPKAKQWFEWTRPRRTFKDPNRRSAVVAASGLNKIVGMVKPRCPHSANAFRTAASCEMHAYRRVTGGMERWIFQADHKCDFIVYIPPVEGSSSFILGDNDPGTLAAGPSTVPLFGPQEAQDCDPLFLHDDEGSSSQVTSSSLVPPPPSQPRVFASAQSNLLPTGSDPLSEASGSSSACSSSSSGAFWISSNSTNFSGQRLHILEEEDNWSDEAIRSPELDTILRHVEKIAPVLKMNARICNHPAIDRNTPPHALRWYHPQLFRCDFDQLQFENTTIARAFQAWNSGEGVTTHTWHIISTSNVFCQACRRMFSYDGFKGHALENKCSRPLRYSCNDEVQVDLQSCIPQHLMDPESIPHPLVEYHPGFLVEEYASPDFYDSMIGRAILEWNSPEGISVTAWYIIITAFVHCPSCNRVRSFDGDLAHRDAHGLLTCSGRVDVVPVDDWLDEAEVSASLTSSEASPSANKGKGRAID